MLVIYIKVSGHPLEQSISICDHTLKNTDLFPTTSHGLSIAPQLRSELPMLEDQLVDLVQAVCMLKLLEAHECSDPARCRRYCYTPSPRQWMSFKIFLPSSSVVFGL